ncbi:hypothetical protein J32TS2_25860 [Shouchella clausii]|nr:hypothetical protein J32TS2_25860 [Shouchella clausii]
MYVTMESLLLIDLFDCCRSSLMVNAAAQPVKAGTAIVIRVKDLAKTYSKKGVWPCIQNKQLNTFASNFLQDMSITLSKSISLMTNGAI